MIYNYYLRKKQIYVLLSILIGIVLVISTWSCKSNVTELTTKRVLEDIAKKHTQIKSYKADFVITDIINGKKDTTEGKIKFKQPILMRQEMNISFKEGEKDLIISNGRIKWMYIPRIKIVFREDLQIADEEFQKKYGIASSYVDMKTIRYIKTDNLNGHWVYILEGLPNKIVRVRDPDAPEKMRVFIDVDTGVVCKVAFYDKQGKEMMPQIFKNFEFN